MDKYIFLHVNNRFVRNILLKSIAKAGIGVMEIMDSDDLTIKLDAYGNSIVLFVTEIVDDNNLVVDDVVGRIRNGYPSIPVLALVYRDTYEIVNTAIKLGIKDILFLTKNSENYVKTIQNKMVKYYEIINKQEEETDLSESIHENVSVKESLNLELKRAIRGNYSISFILVHLNGQEPEVIKSIINTSKRFIRDTDKLLLIDEDTFIGAFHFVEKANVPLLEEKFRNAFKNESKKMGIHKEFCLYGATFPDDGDNLDELLSRLEKGISNMLAINSVRIPLNSLTVSNIENYKKKLRQYKKFF
ncbi:MAG TPA: hypothetical protein GXZ22_04830 [Clostridiaceae bacterium]|nr:hypothetical protein [Clostridiaceae bacterium]